MTSGLAQRRAGDCALPRSRRPASSGVSPALAADGSRAAGESPQAERVQITDPYIEMRTGPGRGYPIFFVARARRVDRDRAAPHRLVQVRTDGGKVGWVHRAQLETTLTAAGEHEELSATSCSTTT